MYVWYVETINNVSLDRQEGGLVSIQSTMQRSNQYHLSSFVWLYLQTRAWFDGVYI